MSAARLIAWAVLQLALLAAFVVALRYGFPWFGALALVVFVLHRRPEW